MPNHAASTSVDGGHLSNPNVPTSVILAAICAGTVVLTALLAMFTPVSLADGPGVLVTALLAVTIVMLMTPALIRKMKAGGMVGVDVNKLARTEVAELGGISALFAFSISLSVVVGLQKLLGNVAEPPFLAAISVFFMASTIGLIDDISNLSQRLKAVAVAFAALPLMLVHFGAPTIDFPLGYQLNLSGSIHLFYWLILVPIGITGVANAMNMSAGYNGLETGQIAIASFALLVVGEVRGAADVSLLVFGALLGCAVGLYYFNRFPATVFIGDIGTLGLGAALGAGVILAHIEFYGLIAISPVFFEAGASLYYGLRGRNQARKLACRNPRIDANGILRPPEGAAHYTLAFWILSKWPMNEQRLVHRLVGLYALCGGVAVLLSVI